MDAIVFVASLALGGLLGYLAARRVARCPGGACLLLASPRRGVLIGAALAALLASGFLTDGLGLGRPRRRSPVVRGPGAADWVAPAAAVTRVQAENQAALNQALAATPGPVLVHLRSAACSGCRDVAQVLAEFTPGTQDALTVVTVDTDRCPTLARPAPAGAPGPCLVLYRGGREVATHAGPLSARELAAWLGVAAAATTPSAAAPAAAGPESAP